MQRSEATTVQRYLEELPEERRAVVAAVRELVLGSLPAGYREVVNWGMITYEVPLERCPDTYNGQPLMYAAVAAQKSHYALYLTAICQDEGRRAALEGAFRAAGKRLDMGRACLRFRRLEDLPLDVVAAAIAAYPVDDFLARYQAIRGG